MAVLCRYLTLIGFVGAVLSTACAFYTGRGRIFAWTACLLLLLEIAVPALVTLHPVPLGILVGVVALGGFGGLTRHRRPKPKSAPRLVRPVANPMPTSRPVTPGDLVGEWSYYADAVASIVIVRFRTDGTYAQEIVTSGGGRTACPGGTWTLNGPWIELTDFRSPTAATTARVRWFFAEGPIGLALFGTDQPGFPPPFHVLRSNPGPQPPG